MPLLPPIRNPLGGLGGAVNPLIKLIQEAHARNAMPRDEWAKTHPYGIPAQMAAYRQENPNPSPWEDEPINTAFKTFAGGLGRQLGEVGMQTIQGLNPVPMVQGAAYSLQHPIERIQTGGDMMLPIGKGPGFRMGPTRTMQEQMQNQQVLDMWRDASRDLNTVPVMSSTKAFALQALQDYKLKNMALDQAAARRARIAQVQRFYEDVNSVLDAPVGAKALWDVDQPIAQRLHDLRQGIRSQLDSGTLTSHTPGAADQLEHVQNRITQGMEIAASRAGSRAPATADLLRRGVQSYLANLPRNRLQNYPR